MEDMFGETVRWRLAGLSSLAFIPPFGAPPLFTLRSLQRDRRGKDYDRRASSRASCRAEDEARREAAKNRNDPSLDCGLTRSQVLFIK